jgi:hypothetical protein
MDKTNKTNMSVAQAEAVLTSITDSVNELAIAKEELRAAGVNMEAVDAAWEMLFPGVDISEHNALPRFEMLRNAMEDAAHELLVISERRRRERQADGDD